MAFVSKAAATATKDVVEFLVKHELTHSVQDTRQWEQLADIAEAQLGDKVWSSQIAEVMETYSAQGETIDLPQAEREVDRLSFEVQHSRK